MNTLKKYLGIVWMIAGPLLVAFMIWQAIEKISLATTSDAKTNTILQWSIILLIFIPICMALVLFGWYAWKNEYQKLPESSDELD
ncbi:MAG: hypothetical protein M3O67_09635 [Bacteroidota bacterium]|nr:hypothetical protein [Bacteroidota bacterium]